MNAVMIIASFWGAGTVMGMLYTICIALTEHDPKRADVQVAIGFGLALLWPLVGLGLLLSAAFYRVFAGRKAA